MWSIFDELVSAVGKLIGMAIFVSVIMLMVNGGTEVLRLLATGDIPETRFGVGALVAATAIAASISTELGKAAPGVAIQHPPLLHRPEIYVVSIAALLAMLNHNPPRYWSSNWFLDEALPRVALATFSSAFLIGMPIWASRSKDLREAASRQERRGTA